MGTGFVWDWRPMGCSASSTVQHWLRSFSGKETAALLFVVLFCLFAFASGAWGRHFDCLSPLLDPPFCGGNF